jgi:hypothetical protein
MLKLLLYIIVFFAICAIWMYVMGAIGIAIESFISLLTPIGATIVIWILLGIYFNKDKNK